MISIPQGCVCENLALAALNIGQLGRTPVLQDFRDESHPNDKKLKVDDLLFTVKDSFFMLKHCLFEGGHMMVRGWGGWFNGRWSFSHGGWQNVRGWRLNIQGPTSFIHSCMIIVSRWLIFLRDPAFYIHRHGLFIQACFPFICIWCILISCRCREQGNMQSTLEVV